MQKQVLYVTPSMASFVKLDIELLRKEHGVDVLFGHWGDAQRVPWLFFIQFFQLLIRFPKTDVVFVSFGGYWSFWPALLGRVFQKPVFIIVHGTDACNFPEIGYGNLRLKALRLFSYLSYRLASRLLPVSDSLMLTTNAYFDPQSHKKLGVLAEFPGLVTPYTVVPNGLDIDFWKTNEVLERRPNTFVTVATQKQIVRKGVDLIVSAAASIPQAVFYVIGCEKPQHMNVPDNVIFTGRLPQHELINHFRTAQFYLQLSVFEGFGLSLCEAMLCGCVPIGSSVNFIPEIIGDDTLILKARSELVLRTFLLDIMTWDGATLQDKSAAAAERIATLFPVSNRSEMLMSLIASN